MSPLALGAEAEATAAAGPAPDHVVQFYEREQSLYELVGRFLLEGLEAGESLMVIATPVHCQHFEAQLRKAGVDVEALRARGGLTTFDAEQTLSRFMVEGMPDRALFREVVAAALEKIPTGGAGRVRGYGEMVDLLWRNGQDGAAVRLEELWNELCAEKSLVLLCAYDMIGFTGAAASEGLRKVRAQHAPAPSPEGASASPVAAPRGPASTEGAPSPAAAGDYTRQLEAEIELRKRLERALRESLAERRRAEAEVRSNQQTLADLRQLAFGLSDQLDVDGVIKATLELVLNALHAKAGVVALVQPDGMIELRQSIGYASAAMDRLRRLAPDASIPVAEAIRRRAPVVWPGEQVDRLLPAAVATSMQELGPRTVAAVPMLVEGSCIGAIVVTLPSGPGTPKADAQFLQDVAQQCGMGIRRAQLAEQGRAATRQLRILAEASRAFAAASQDLDLLFETVAKQVAVALAAACEITLISADGRQLETQHLATHDDPEAPRILGDGPRPAPRNLGEGVPGKVAATGQAMWLSEISEIAPARSLLVVPVRSSGRVLGTLGVARYGAGELFSAAHAEFLQELADRAALAIDNTRLYQRERSARQSAESAAHRTRQLQDLTSALSRARTTAEVTAAVVDTGCKTLGAQAAFGWMLTADGQALELVASSGYQGPRIEAFRRIPVDAPLPLCEVLRTGAPMLIGSLDELERGYPLSSRAGSSDFGAWAVLPFMVAGRGIGGVSLSFSAPRAFAKEDSDLLVSMIEQASSALERCRLFEAEKAARGLAEEADRRKDEFLAMLGHELRNPLAPIQTALQLMRLRDEKAVLRERMIIERQVGHLERLIDDLLDISRITRGRIDLKRDRCEVAEIVAKALEQADRLLEQRNHRLHLQVARSGLAVDGDQVRLAQVVANLLTNAAKYTEPGGEIWVTAEAEANMVVLRVRDTGAGIAPELLPRIFELFTQATQTLARAQGGLGLGLAIVQRLVDLHGGRVEARSEGPGRGSEFIVWLPAAAATGTVGRAAHGPLPPVAAGTRPSRRLLVVDDNEDAAALLAEALDMMGYQVQVAHDGPQALARVAAFQPEIALVDIGLPVMDGYELAQRLREELGDGQLRLLAVTGYGQEKDRARALAAGFEHHLVKPINLDRLAALLADMVGSDS
jgi:signal transduction histidine kinase/CheY-like chemotaxis protein